MITKACTNSKCPAYAHFVYTVAMRCVLCRWDLKSAQRINDALGEVHNSADTSGTASSRKARARHAA
ncbi:MAG: hypothetical protein WCA76_11010 [Candidatus Sulfotelmatobacter sp.]|jgi:hypothetical protein